MSKPCRYKGCDGACFVVMGPFQGHNAYAHWQCPKCDRHNDWIKKPENARKRAAGEVELAKKYGNGYCELCLRSQDEIRKIDGFVGHHVIEHQHGGTGERSNIWVVCTACHQFIHWMRTYAGNDHPRKDSGTTSQGRPVGNLEERPPW